jgi:hypothetical protein
MARRGDDQPPAPALAHGGELCRDKLKTPDHREPGLRIYSCQSSPAHSLGAVSPPTAGNGAVNRVGGSCGGSRGLGPRSGGTTAQ